MCMSSHYSIAEETTAEIFEKFWKQARETIYPKSKQDSHFTDKNYQRLKKASLQSKDIYEFTPLINRFLKTLDVSHTHFYNDRDIDFYMFRSMFATKKINDPKVNHIGIQFVRNRTDYIVREVVDGYPAYNAGLRRGDIIVSSDGGPFHPYLSFNSTTAERKLKVKRNDVFIELLVKPVFENPNYSFQQAVEHSARVLNVGGKRVGYVHLWTGIHDDVLASFTEIITNQFKEVDAIILDLRGGFGGAWYPYFDPFFPNRKDYFNYTMISQSGESSSYSAEAKTNGEYFSGPMVVLINEGVRSGKESLAYQFKKNARATLIGATTQGAFTAGKSEFNHAKNYFLFIASAEGLLDGNKVEGVGIKPDIVVPYPIAVSLEKDPQFDRALLEMELKLGITATKK